MCLISLTLSKKCALCRRCRVVGAAVEIDWRARLHPTGRTIMLAPAQLAMLTEGIGCRSPAGLAACSRGRCAPREPS
jgi:hypothetical protein